MLAIVPARGGSKRIPRKSIKPLLGKPLIQYTLEAAISSKTITRIIVTTDDAEIHEVAARVPGVDIPFTRPAEFATDHAQAVDVHMHVLDWIKEHEGTRVEEYCILLPTAPLRLPEDIDGAITMFHDQNAEAVLGVMEAKPLSWHQNIEASGRMSALDNMDPIKALANHQELPKPPVVLNGGVMVLNAEKVRSTRTYFGDKTYGYLMPWSRSIDIDEMDEFKMAEALMAYRLGIKDAKVA